jgi:uncharacterized phage protein (TIGR02218 family)
MPREISEQFKNQLAEPILKIAHCIKISLQNGEVYAFTTHSQNILCEDIEYKINSAFKPSAIIYKDGLAVDNVEVSSLLNFLDDGVEAGKLDGAVIEIFIVNYERIEYGKMLLFKGMIGEVWCDDNKFIAQVRGLTQKYSANIGSIYSPNCRATFCDTKCKLNISDYSYKANVKKVLDERTILISIIKDSGYFNSGKIEFITGKNRGKKYVIRNYFEGTVELLMKPSFPITRGDKLILIAGCDKQIETCAKKFNNAINFRGEPHLPKLTN